MSGRSQQRRQTISDNNQAIAQSNGGGFAVLKRKLSFQESGDKLAEKFIALVNNKYLSDVIFLVGPRSRQIFAHRAFLAVHSSVFKELINVSHEELPVMLEISDVDPENFLQLMNFIYTGRILIKDYTQMIDLLTLADRFCIDSLAKILLKYIENDISIKDKVKLPQYVDNSSRIQTTAKKVTQNPSNTADDSQNKSQKSKTDDSEDYDTSGEEFNIQYNTDKRQVEFSDTIKRRIKVAKQRIEERARKAYASDELDWYSQKISILKPRAMHTTISYGNVLILIGGDTQDGTPPGIEFFNPETQKLVPANETGLAPKLISQHAACRIGEKIYVYGGVVNKQISSKMFVLTIIRDETTHWSNPRVTGVAPPSLCGHSLVRYENNLVLFGGFDGKKYDNSVHLIDVSDNNKCTVMKTTGDIPKSRRGHSAAVVGNRMLVLGGHDEDNFFNDLYCLNFETAEWKQVSLKATVPRMAYHQCVTLGTSVLIYGGKRKNGSTTKDVWKIVIGKRYNEGFNKDEINSEINFVNYNYPLVPRDQTSSSGPSSLGTSPTVSSLAHNVTAHVNNTNTSATSASGLGANSPVLSANKSNKLSDKNSNVSALSDEEEIEWMKIRCNEAPSERYGHTMSKLGSKLFVIGGRNESGVYLNDVWTANTVKLPLEKVRLIDYSEIELQTIVGKGFFSQVRRGIYKNTIVAVKQIRTVSKEKSKSRSIQDFKTEVELLSQLKHPNLVSFYGYCVEPNAIVMEYLPQNLHDYLIENRGNLDKQQLVEFAYDIAKGMSYLHQNNIIHRDLKSFNILHTVCILMAPYEQLDENLNVKVADFGIARVKSHASTMTSYSAGTIAWTAPEILRHETYNEKSDVYSFAIVLWEMMSEGDIPFDEWDPMEAGIAVATGRLRPPLHSNISDKSWHNLIERCWSEFPNDRPSFDDIMEMLKKFE